jgi:hypothetical protein
MKEVLVECRERKIADLNFSGLVHDLSDNFFPSVTRCCRCRAQNLHFTYSLGFKSLKAENLAPQIFCHTQNFDILRVPPLQIPTKKA